MSFSAVASYSNDKGSSLFGQSCEDLGADFFDQFLTFDPIDDEGPNYSHLAESTHSEKSAHHSGIGGTTSNDRVSEGRSLDAQESSWYGAINQKPVSSQSSSALFYSEATGRAALSDGELLCLENISLGSPISPLSPQPRAHSLPSASARGAAIARRKNFSDFIPKVFKKAVSFDKSLRSPIRKTPNMIRGSQSFQGSLDLTTKFQFDFERPMIPLSPPQSARVSDASETSAARFAKGSNNEMFEYNNGLSHFSNAHAQYDTPLATPILDGQHSRRTSAQLNFSDAMNFPSTPQFQNASGNWSQVSGSTEFSSFGTPVIHTPDTDAPMWWNHAATAPMAQPSPTALHSNPHRATRSLANQLSHDLPFESNGLGSSDSKMATGLMISMPESDKQSFVITSPLISSPHISPQSYFGQSQPHSRHRYPPPPPTYPITHPHPSLPMHQSHHADRHSESPSPKTASSSFSVRKSRKPKSAKGTPRTPSSAAADFVNFTPSDSRKILTGVAPSGSSKTKARREKEAMEKRRRLSLAAMRAVRAAGGDVESLVEQGLFA